MLLSPHLFGKPTEQPVQITFINDKKDSSTQESFIESLLPKQLKEKEEKNKNTAKKVIFKILEGPVAGYRVDSTNNNTIVKAIKGGTGGSYKINFSPFAQTKIAPGELLRVTDALVFKNNKALLLFENKITNTIDSVILTIDEESQSAQKTIFETNIKAASNNLNSFAYVKTASDQSSKVRVIDLENQSNNKTIFSSGISSWNIDWGNNSFITLSSPISAFAQSVVYLIENTRSKESGIERVGGGIRYGAKIDEQTDTLLEFSNDESNTIGQLTLKRGDVKAIIETTLPEKCAGRNGIFICSKPNLITGATLSGYRTSYPDSWYQGDLVLSESLVIVNTISGEVEELLNLQSGFIREETNGEIFDIVKPQITTDGKYFIFINKYDKTLWGINLQTL